MKKFFVLFAVFAALLTACGGTNQTASTASAPDFNLSNSLGGKVSLKDYDGKNVLLFFHMAVG